MSTTQPINRPAPKGPAQRPRLASRLRKGLGRAAAGLALGPQRRTVLALTGAVIGLAVAGYGLLHPANREPVVVPAGDVALVNGEPILMTDYVSETEQALGTPFDMISPADKAKALRDMVDQELMVQRALALDLPEQDTNVRSALGDSVTALVNASVGGAEGNTGTLASPPPDDLLRAYFNAHKANYATRGAMTLTDLVLHVGGFENVDQTTDQAMADAAQAAYELRSGATLDYVKQHFSFADSGKVTGEQPDFAAHIHLGDKLYAVAQAMTDGQISDPVADTDGVHVMIMDHRQPPVFYDYDSVKNNVYTDYAADQKARAKRDNLNFLRRGAKILVAPGFHE
jgi:hypothetical protein